MSHPFTAFPSGLRLRHCLTPRSSKDAVRAAVDRADGAEADPVLQCAVRAGPEKGEANAVLVNLLACWLDIPKSTISFVAGSKSRYKTLDICGDPDQLARDTAKRIAALETDTKPER